MKGKKLSRRLTMLAMWLLCAMGVAAQEAATRLVVVAPGMFGEGLQGFVDWKRQEGYEVEEIYVETTDRDSIRAMIGRRMEAMAAAGRTTYILLVGDAELLPPFPGTSRPEGFTNHTTDLYYAEHTGDYLPDALLGRWPVGDTAELRRVVDKTLRYEQCRDLDTAQLRRVMLVAGGENQQPAPVTTNGQVNYVKRRLAATLPGVDTLCWYNPASDTLRDDILRNIGQGAALVSYTAHCAASGWSHPAVDYAAIDTLGESQPSFYINNCCKSNAFDADGFGEQLLRKAVGGAVGVIGATNSTLWNEDYYWAVGPKYPFSLEPDYDSLLPGAFDRWLGALGQAESVYQTAGGILKAGNMAVTAFGSPYDKFYWEIYCLLGDPTLRPMLGAPRPLWAAVADTVRVGETLLAVVATPGATVTAVQGHRLLGVARAGDDSLATMTLALPLDTLPLLLTATAPQSIPAIDTVQPLPPQGAAVSFRNVAVADTAVDFTLANIGNDTVFNLGVALQPDTSGALFVATIHMVDTLPPHAALPLHTTLNVTRWALRWSGTLATTGDTAVRHCSLALGHALGAPPTLSFTLLDTAGNVATAVMPATEYLLAVSVEGEYDTLAVDISPADTSHLSPLTFHLTTPDSINRLRLHGHVGRGSYGRDYDYWLNAGRREESFEEGFDSHPWNLATMRPWVIDSTERHSGSYSLRSAHIDYRQTSDLVIDVLLMADDSISFWVKTSSEEGYDKVVFSVDGQHRGSWSGFVDWYRRAYLIPSGRHTLRWRYFKDESGNTGQDCGWIDDLRMPLALWDTPCGWFAPDTVAPPVAIDREPEAAAAGTAIKVYPNPVERWLTVDAAGEVTVTDMYGRAVMRAGKQQSATRKIDLGRLPSGMYIVGVRSGDEVCHYRIVKQ